MFKDKIRNFWDFLHFAFVIGGMIFFSSAITSATGMPFYIIYGIILVTYTGVAYFFLGMDLREMYGIGFPKIQLPKNSNKDVKTKSMLN